MQESLHCASVCSDTFLCAKDLHIGWHKASIASSPRPEKSSNDCLSGFSVPSCDMADAEPRDLGQNILPRNSKNVKLDFHKTFYNGCKNGRTNCLDI